MLFCEVAQHMNVIGYAANRDRVAFEVLQDAGRVSPHAATNGWGQPRAPLFGRKDDMAGEDVQGLGHARMMIGIRVGYIMDTHG